MIRTLIIDDEPSAVGVLKLLLKKRYDSEVEVVATTNNPLEGKAFIEHYAPDLVFLDVEMPGLSGIDLARSFEHPSFAVVFITAYDAYAIDAFRLCALDYLLKPIDVEDLDKAIEKYRENSLHRQQTAEKLRQLQKLLTSQWGSQSSNIGIGMADKIVFVKTSDIVYCEAKGSYTHVHLKDGGRVVASKQLGDFEGQLGTSNFFRIHHSYVINLNSIREFQKHDGGYVMMENGHKLDVSQRKRKDFLEAIQKVVI